MSKQKVVDIVKNYVARCGGSVPIEYLLQDYKIAYKCELPYVEFGYSSVVDFLESLSEITLFDEEDGVTYVESFEYALRRKEQSDPQLSQLDDLSQLSVQMTNNLLLGESRDAPRVVKIQPVSNAHSMYKKFLNRSSSSSFHSSRSEEENGGSNVEVSSGNDYVSDLSNYSRENHANAFTDYETTYTNSLYENERAADSYHSAAKSYEEIYTPDDPYSLLSTTNNAYQSPHSYPPDLYGSIFGAGDGTQPQETVYSPDLLLASKHIAEPLNVHIPDAYQSSVPSENVSKLPDSYHLDTKPQSAYIPNAYHSPSHSSDVRKRPDIFSFNTKPQDAFNTFNGFQPPSPAGEIPVLSDNYFSATKPAQSAFTSPSNVSGCFMDYRRRSSGMETADSWFPKATDTEIVCRVVKLVNSQNQVGGIDSLTIELKYTEIYSTALPKHWLSLLEETHALYMEKITAGTIIYPNRWFPIAPTSKFLPNIRYPDIRNRWAINVTSYENTACVWFRIAEEDFEQKYEYLRKQMDRYYKRVMDNLKNLNEVTNGQLCSVHFKNEWFRGEVLESDTCTKSARCLLIDEGLVYNFHYEKIYELDEKYTNTPALAIQGVLSGLEKWQNCNYINCKLQQSLCNEQEVRVKINKFIDDKRPSMTVFVQQNSQFVDLNFKIMELAKNELTLPVLYANQVYPVNLLNVLDNNSAQIQIRSPSLTLLEKTLLKVEELMKDAKNREQVKVDEMTALKVDKIYLARCEDGRWRRIYCRQFHPNNKVSALFIDYAEVKTIYLHDIFDSCIFADSISFISPQAVLVKMLDMDALVLRCLLKNSSVVETFSVKILRSEAPPIVQFLGELPGGGVAPVLNILNMLNNVSAHPPVC